MKSVDLTIVQCRSVLGDLEGNVSTMERFILSNPDADIICFPEMCLTGYTSSDAHLFAIGKDDPAIDRVVSLSKEHSVSVVFGFIERSSEGLHLRQEAVVPDGHRFHYRKSHLGTKEASVFIPGDELPVFDLGGVMVGIHLCTESHIPDISAVFRSKGAELILVPFANVISGERRRNTWHRFLPARANDNGIYLAACSAVGKNGAGVTFGGGLIVIDPKGVVIEECYLTDECSISVTIGGDLPRDGPESMTNISYFDRRRPELYSFKM